LITPKPEAKKEWQEQLKDTIGVTCGNPWQKNFRAPETDSGARSFEQD